MVEKKISQEFRLKNVDETKNYFLKQMEKNSVMSRNLVQKGLCNS